MKFLDKASFVAINAESRFTLIGATFSEVPDFEQSHFSEAPQLSETRFRLRNCFERQIPQRGVAARWRALKRLAIQAHDHEREQLFFAEEIKALRNAYDQPLPNFFNLFSAEEKFWRGGARYWVGFLYQVTSNFGRSIVLPVLWWCVTVISFGAFYFISRGGSQNCIAGVGDPWTSALYLAIHKGSVLAGIGGSDKLTQVYSCLYGVIDGNARSAIIPDAIAYAGIIQTTLSAVIGFLVVLALRNYFRIK